MTYVAHIGINIIHRLLDLVTSGQRCNGDTWDEYSADVHFVNLLKCV